MGRGCGGGEEGRAGPTSRAGEGEGTIHGDNTNTCPGVCAWPGFAAENAWAGELTRVRYRARGCAAMGGAGARVTGHGAERDREGWCCCAPKTQRRCYTLLTKGITRHP